MEGKTIVSVVAVGCFCLLLIISFDIFVVLAGNLAHVNSSDKSFGLFSHCQTNLIRYDNVKLYKYKI